MSTAETGDAAVAKAIVDQAKELLADASADAEQLELLAVPTAEEMAEAREELGPGAGRLTVLRHAREKRRGRPAGARNKRTDDFARYILSFGQDPAITLMEIQSTPEEAMMEASVREFKEVTSSGAIITYTAPTLNYEAARSLRIRCAEALMPFIHSKKPVAIDATIRGVRVVEELSSPDGPRDPFDGGDLRLARPDELGEKAA